MSKVMPVYLIAGGRWDNFENILRSIFKQAGIEKPIVSYIGAANADRNDFFTSAREALLSAGASLVKHVKIGPSGWQNSLKGCGVVFVSGGDVEQGMAVLQKAKAIPLLQGMRAEGKIFIGVSAGSIMLANKWIAWPDKRDEENVRIFPCLGIADVYCDAHDEPGWEELRALLTHLSAGAIGIGLRSGSAVSVCGKNVTVIAGKVDNLDISLLQSL